jgi:phosphonoacetaldehyde hydrolase
VRTLQRVFARQEIHLSDDVARRDMGIAKKEHIRNLLAEPEVRTQWHDKFNRAPAEKDVESLYAEFLPLQMECLPVYSQVLDGVAGTVENLRSKGIKIGSTTGYTRPMLEELLVSAAKQGYRPDKSLCPEDVGAGRPHPYMCFQLAVSLHVYPLWECAKIGDTASDMAEGRNAGMWTIGISRTGNLVGLSEAEWLALDPAERERRVKAATEALQKSGAHYVAENVAGCLPILDEIEVRLRNGSRP